MTPDRARRLGPHSALVLLTAFLLTAAGLPILASSAAAEQWVFPRTTQPRHAVTADRSPTELGMRFRVKRPGVVLGVRFYDTAKNVGPHRGRLWSSTGRRLASAVFSRREVRGWRSVTFSRPVRVVPDRTYTVSYFAPHGRYARDARGFRHGITRGDLVVPARAGVYRHGRGFPRRHWRAANYYVDVRFVTRRPPVPAATALPLPREPWYGGPAYYNAFPKAKAAGWTSPRHFPISVFLGKPSHAPQLAAVGVNTYMGAEHDGSPISMITSRGISVIAQDEWTPAEVGSDPRVVGWHVSDECDMGAPPCQGSTEFDSLRIQQGLARAMRAHNDGRFLQANFSNGVFGTWWSPTTMPQHVALMDLTSVDKYAYTSPDAREGIAASPYWPQGKNPMSAGAYGWLQDRMETFSSPRGSTPNWVFVETAMPYLNEAGARTISPDQIGGAVWNAIIHGASGIAYFQHNNNALCGDYSLVDCSQTLKDSVTAIDAEVRGLAPVLNTPSFVWSFGSGLETALKAAGGSMYVFAMTSGGTGSRTFRLPPGLTTGDVQVVGEGRTLPVSGGTFTDTFAAEYTHHIYKIALAG